MIVFFLTITYPQQKPTVSFHEFGQQPYNLIGTKESVYIKKELSNKPIKTRLEVQCIYMKLPRSEARKPNVRHSRL